MYVYDEGDTAVNDANMSEDAKKNVLNSHTTIQNILSTTRKAIA